MENIITILLAEINDHLADDLDNLLSGEGYNVIRANSGKQTLELALLHLPHLILLSSSLTKKFSADIIKSLRKNRHTAELYIVLTGTAGFTFGESGQYTESGPDDFLPFTSEKNEIRLRVKSIIKSINTRIQLTETRKELCQLKSRYVRAEVIGGTGNWEYDLINQAFWGSDQAKRIYGFDPASDFFSVEEVESCIPERERVHQALTDLIEHGKEYNLEFEIIPVDTGIPKTILSKAELEFDKEGNPVRVTGVIMDVTDQRKMALLARVQNERFEDIFNTVGEGIAYTNLAGKVLSVNSALEEILGISKTDLIGKNILSISRNLLTLKNLKATLPLLKAIIAGNEIPSFEVEYKDKTLELHSRINRSTGTLTGVVRDITDQKKARVAIAESRLRLIEAQRISKIGNWEWIPSEDRVIWSDEMYRIFGKKAGSVQTTADSILSFHPDDVPLVEAATRTALSEKKAQKMEARVVKPDGEIIWVTSQAEFITDKKGEILKVYGTYQDITDRKLHEEALAESEEKYRRIVETAMEGIWSMDEEFRTTFINQSMSQMLGYEDKEMTGRLVHDFIFAEDMNEHMARIAERKKGLFGRYERRFRRKDGSECWCLVSSKPITDSLGNFAGSFAMMADITAIKQAESSLRKTEKYYRTLIEEAPDGVVLIDQQGHFSYASPAAMKMFGYNQDDIRQLLPNDLTHPEELPFVLEELGKVIGNKDYQPTIQYRFRHSDGTWHWIESTFTNQLHDPDIRAIVINFRNIEERRKAEDELREYSARWQKTFDGINDRIFLLDQNGKIIQANASAHKKFSGTKGDIIGQPCSIVVHQSDCNVEGCPLLLAKKSLRRETMRMPVGDKVFEVIVDPILDSDGTLSGAIHIVTDITEKIRIEQELKAIRERFELAMLASRDGLYDWNLITNEIYYSPGWKSMLGYGHEELPNDITAWEKLTHPDDVTASWTMLQEVISKNRDRFEMEFRMKHKDGHWVDILSRARAYFNDDGIAYRVVGTHVDISELKKSQKELAENRRFLSEVIANSGALIYVKNIDGTYRLVNKTWELVTGYKTAETLGKTDIELFRGQDGKNFREIDLQVLKSGRMLETEEVLNDPTGTKHFISIKFPIRDTDGKITGLCGMSTEITARKLMEDNLREREALLYGLFNNMSSGAAIYEVKNNGSSGDDYIIRYFNKISLQIENLTAEEVIGKSLKELRPAIDDYGLIPVFRKVWETGEPAMFPAKIYIDEKFHNYYENYIFKIPTGEIVAIYNDVTIRMRAEEELKSKMRELERFNDLTVGRELKMIELKKEINALLAQTGRNIKYDIPE